MVNKNLEANLFELLENYSLEDIVFVLFRYADTQAKLAKTLQQPQAASKWQLQAYELGSVRF